MAFARPKKDRMAEYNSLLNRLYALEQTNADGSARLGALEEAGASATSGVLQAALQSLDAVASRQERVQGNVGRATQSYMARQKARADEAEREHEHGTRRLQADIDALSELQRGGGAGGAGGAGGTHPRVAELARGGPAPESPQIAHSSSFVHSRATPPGGAPAARPGLTWEPRRLDRDELLRMPDGAGLGEDAEFEPVEDFVTPPRGGPPERKLFAVPAPAGQARKKKPATAPRPGPPAGRPTQLSPEKRRASPAKGSPGPPPSARARALKESFLQHKDQFQGVPGFMRPTTSKFSKFDKTPRALPADVVKRREERLKEFALKQQFKQSFERHAQAAEGRGKGKKKKKSKGLAKAKQRGAVHPVIGDATRGRSVEELERKVAARRKELAEEEELLRDLRRGQAYSALFEPADGAGVPAPSERGSPGARARAGSPAASRPAPPAPRRPTPSKRPGAAKAAKGAAAPAAAAAGGAARGPRPGSSPAKLKVRTPHLEAASKAGQRRKEEVLREVQRAREAEAGRRRQLAEDIVFTRTALSNVGVSPQQMQQLRGPQVAKLSTAATAYLREAQVAWADLSPTRLAVNDADSPVPKARTRATVLSAAGGGRRTIFSSLEAQTFTGEGGLNDASPTKARRRPRPKSAGPPGAAGGAAAGGGRGGGPLRLKRPQSPWRE